MARIIRSLQHNVDWGENRPAHREHRSKRGRNRMFKLRNEKYWKFKKQKEALIHGFDEKSLRYIREHYKI